VAFNLQVSYGSSGLASASRNDGFDSSCSKLTRLDEGIENSRENSAEAEGGSAVALRARRKRLVKGRTINTRKLVDGAAAVSEQAFIDFPEGSVQGRPGQRSECASGVRPCPYVSCRYHLYLEVSPKTGSLKLNFPDLEVWELQESCALDVADRGEQSTEKLGELLNLTPERARQLEQRVLRLLATSLDSDRDCASDPEP
jgi:hypothetical protein